MDFEDKYVNVAKQKLVGIAWARGDLRSSTVRTRKQEQDEQWPEERGYEFGTRGYEAVTVPVHCRIQEEDAPHRKIV